MSSSASARLRRLHDRLAAAYGPQHWWPGKTTFEIIVGAYLTQNTAWKSVQRSIANLRRAGALSVAGLRAVPLAELRRLIRPSGFYTRKAPALKAFIALLDAEHRGSLRRMAAAPTAALRLRLLALPGVGPETADAILLYAFGHPVPVADEYLRRIAHRHALLTPARAAGSSSVGASAGPATEKSSSAGRTYEALSDLTRRAFAADPAARHAQLFNEFHALTVAVGKAHCGRNPRCAGCPLAYDLESAPNA